MLCLKFLSRFLIIALAMSCSVEAAEWSAEPRVSLRTGYNDNIRLTTAAHDSVWETDLSPSVKFGVARENQGVFGVAGFAIRRFSGGSGRESSSVLDREDYHLNTNAYHRTERNTFSGNIIYTRDSTLDSQLDETGNVVSNRATRDRFTLGPSWERILSEKMRLNLNYQFTTVSYSDDPGISNLVKYDSQVLSSSLVRQFTPRIQGTISASYSRYEPETGFDSSTINLQAGISRNFSETLVASFLAGQRKTTSDSLYATGGCLGADPGASFPSCTGGIAIPTGTRNDETDTSGSVFSANITKTLETGVLRASLSRSTNPGSNGELLDATRLSLFGEHRFTEKLRTTLSIGITQNETIVNRVGRETNQDKETYINIIPRVSYRWSREWELAGDYQYAKNKTANSNTATRNAVYLTLSYRPMKVSLSR